MAFIEVRRVHRRFGGHTAANNVSFEAERGEFVTLLGPSGSGKTTLLRIVAGFETPDSGQVVVDGEDVTALPAQRRNMGMVFQSYALFPNMTAADNVAFGLKTRRRPQAEVRRRVEELLSMVGLAGKASNFPHQLSGGEQQRVALARALAPNPRLLLLDEPLSALDAQIRATLRAEIRRIQKTLNMTTLYVTHDQEEALSMSDSIVVFNQGRVEQMGSPRTIYDRPATPFVSTFVGTMNRLPATISNAAAGKCTVGNQEITVDRLPPGTVTGDAVEIWVRPEALKLRAACPSREPNELSAVVEQVMFLGGHVGVRASLEGVVPVVLDVPRLDQSDGVHPGDTIGVCLPAGVTVTPVDELTSQPARESVG